jgi:hypothetical protein
MAIRIAVVTDALSDQFYFPVWRQYYGGLFGDANLFVVAYEAGAEFRGPGLGGVVRLPVRYDNATRANVVAGVVATLLGAYDVVIRVDTDELLVVDPRTAPTLRDYIESTNRPYYTARGFDVVQVMGEPPVEPGAVLRQRRYAYPNSALNKTGIVRMPLRWSHGFHWADVHPECGPLFMLHLKRVDIDWQLRWNDAFSRNMAGNPQVPKETRDKYVADQETILGYHLGVSTRPRLTGIESWYRDGHQQRFMDAVVYTPKSGLYVGSYEHDNVLCEIPAAWKDLF